VPASTTKSNNQTQIERRDLRRDRNKRRRRVELFSRVFLKETLASSNGAEAVTVFWRNEQIRGTDEPVERAMMPGREFSRRFLKETFASSNGAEAVMVFWWNEQIRGTDESAERATTPGGAFSRGFLDETDDFRNEHGTPFLRNGRICRTDEFAELTLCGTSDDAEWSVSCGILEETVVSSNSAESVMVFWQNNSEFAESTSLWN